MNDPEPHLPTPAEIMGSDPDFVAIDDRVPASGPFAVRVFDRFKYAEEHAHDLVNGGRLFRMWNVPDVSHEEDGEVYVYDEFHVADLGPGSEETP